MVKQKGYDTNIKITEVHYVINPDNPDERINFITREKRQYKKCERIPQGYWL